MLRSVNPRLLSCTHLFTGRHYGIACCTSYAICIFHLLLLLLAVLLLPLLSSVYPESCTSSYLFRVTADAVPLADFVALDVVAVFCPLAVEVGPGSASTTLADRGWATGLETVRAVVDALGSPVCAE